MAANTSEAGNHTLHNGHSIEEPEELNFIDHWLDLTVESEISRGIKLRVAKEQANTYRNDCDGFGLDPFRYCAKRRHRCRKTPWINPNIIQPIPSCTKRSLLSPTSPIPRSISNTPDPASKCYQRCSLRIAELAMPSKRQCIETWRSKAHTLPGYMVERLKQHVMDQKTVAHIPDAINCFKTGKRLPKKRKHGMTRNGYKQTQEYLIAIRNLCAVFGHKIAQILIKPQNIVLTPELEKISNVIIQEISGVMKNNEMIYRREVDNKTMHKEISHKITVWIAKILDDSDEILLEEDLRVKKLNEKKMEKTEQFVTLIEEQTLGKNCEDTELDEEEGPVLDFLDNLVDNVFTVCATVSDTSDDDSNDHEKLNEDNDSNQETRSSLYHTGDSTELQDTEHEILSETLDKIDIKDHILHEIERLVDDEIPSDNNDIDKTAKNQLSGKIEENFGTHDTIESSTAVSILINDNDIETSDNKLQGNVIDDKDSKNTTERRLDKNGTSLDDSVTNKIINEQQRDEKENLETENVFRPPDRRIGLSSDKNDPEEGITKKQDNFKNNHEKGVTQIQDNSNEDNFKRESTVEPVIDVNLNSNISTERTFNKLQGDAITGEKIETENIIEQMDKTVIESVNNNVTDLALQYTNNEIEKVLNELQSDATTDEKIETENIMQYVDENIIKLPNNIVTALKDKTTNNEGDDEVKYVMFVDNNNNFKCQLNTLIGGTNLSEEITIEAKRPLDEKNKAVTFSRIDMVIGEKITEQSDDSNTFSENDQERSEQWRMPSEHRHIVFSAANEHLLSDADELWSDDVSFPLLKISASINKSITSLEKITDIDEGVLIPPDEEIKQDNQIRHLVEKSINIMEPELKYDKIIQAEVKYHTKSTDTILLSRNNIKLQQQSKIDRATQVKLPHEANVKKNSKLKESPELHKDTGKGDHIHVDREPDKTVQPQTYIPKQKVDYKMNRIFAKPNKKELEKEWINLKKCTYSDAVYFRNLKQRAQGKLTTYKQGRQVKLRK